MSHDLRDTLRRRVLPWFVWVGLVVGAALAYRATGSGTVARGFAEAMPYRLSSVEPAEVESILVNVGDRVSAGQVLAILDGRALEGELNAVRAHRARVLAEIEKSALEAQAAYLDARQGLANGAAETERAEREAQTRLETAKAELQAVGTELSRRKKAVADGLMRSADLSDLEIRQSALKRQVSEVTAALRLYRDRNATVGAFETPALEDGVKRATAPLEKELEVYDGEARALEARQSQRVLRAPVDGKVSAIHGQPRSVVTPDLPLIEVVGDGNHRIVACLPDDHLASLSVGGRALATPRGRKSDALVGHSVAITPVIELPTRCWRDPRAPAWGRVVTVEVDPKSILVPGEPFDIRFELDDGT